jgi:hypothetical protein
MDRTKEEEALLERAALALEGVEMLIAMWLEKTVPAGEIWVGEGPDRDLSRRPWRLAETVISRPAGALDSRIRHIEERMDRLNSDLVTLAARVHEEPVD